MLNLKDIRNHRQAENTLPKFKIGLEEVYMQITYTWNMPYSGIVGIPHYHP